jgi:hypothetical protein
MDYRGHYGDNWGMDNSPEKVMFGVDISLLELFMLRVSVKERINSLEASKKKAPDISAQFDEMLSIYNPLYQKIDTEIEKRSVKR